jgi:hypothetical protein
MKNEKAYLKKFVYKEIDEDELSIQEEKVKLKVKKQIKLKDCKIKKIKKNPSVDWD